MNCILLCLTYSLLKPLDFEKWKKKALKEKRTQPIGRRSSHSSIVDILSTDFAVTSNNFKVEGVASSYLCESRGDLIFSVQSNPSFHPPPDASKPLVMIAASSGVSPFMAFIQERCANKNAGETILLWSIPYIKEGMHILKDLEHMLERAPGGDKISIFINITRESTSPVFIDGKFTLVSRPCQRVTEYIERNVDLRRRLHDLLVPE